MELVTLSINGSNTLDLLVETLHLLKPRSFIHSDLLIDLDMCMLYGLLWRELVPWLCRVVDIYNHLESLLGDSLLIIVHEIKGENLVKVLPQPSIVCEIHIIEVPHVLEHYSNGCWFIVPCKAMILTTEDPKEALVYELGAKWVRRVIEGHKTLLPRKLCW